MRFLCLLICFFCIKKTQAQDVGKPFLNHYAPKEYNAYSQNWGLAQDERGLIYVGNFDGILEYDGVSWRLIKVSNLSTVNAICYGNDKRIYIAAVSEFGYLEPDERGTLIYVSLLPKTDKKFTDFQDVLDVKNCRDGIYFNAADRIFFWNGDTVKVTQTNNDFSHTFEVESEFYVLERGYGLLKGKNGVLSLCENGRKYASEEVHDVFRVKNDIAVLASGKNFVTGLRHDKIDDENLMQKISPENQDFINSKRVLSIQKLPDNNFAFFSVQYGGILLSKNGDFLKKLDKKIGLRSEQIHWSFTDKHHGLWLANNSGVSRMELYSPFRFWDESMGLNSMVLSLGEDKRSGKIYAGTFQGCYVLEGDFFKQLPGVKRGVWGFKNLQFEDKNFFFVGSSGGLFLLENEELQLTDGIRALSLFVSEKDTKRLYAGTPYGFSVYDFVDSKWKKTVHHDSLGAEIRSFADDTKTSDLWLCSAYNGVLRLELSSRNPFLIAKIHRYDTLSGLPSNNWTNAAVLDGENIFLTEKGIYKFDRKNNRFYAETSLVKNNRSVFRLLEDKKGNIWLSGITTQKGEILCLKKRKSGFSADNLPFKRIPDMGVEALTEDSKGNIWFGGSEGLFRFSPDKKHFYRLSYKTLIRKVVAKDDSLVFGGAFFVKKNNSNFISEKQTHKVILPYSHNKIAFYFSAASYEEPKSSLFSYKLDGFDKDWSAWQKDSKSDYTNLREGEYKFRVKSKNVFGVIGDEAEFSFVIQPPFYRTYFAYFLYALATVLILHFLIKFNTRRLRKQNEQLEKIISERTAEVMAQKNALAGKNIELEQQKEEILVQAENLRDLNNEVSTANLMLEKKNSEVETALKDIKAGINYALRIQSAMLPKSETLQKYLSDFFIFFRPRDTVSGDFYWFEHIEEKNISILALADCTGHGVPGAFMSLIGKDSLDKIILNNEIFSPAKILEALDLGIKISLKQEDSAVRDGMEIGICVWLHKENKLLFAGAKQNLTAIFNQEIYEWAGNKVSIAAVRRPENFVYTETEINLNDYKNAKFYLFSDGIQDQFGGTDGKKITKKTLKEWLFETQSENMSEQGKKIEHKIDQWLHFSSHNEEQIDDMLLIGFSLTF